MSRGNFTTHKMIAALATALLCSLGLSTSAQQMEPRNQDIPRRLLDLRNELRIGQIWVARNSELSQTSTAQAVRASLEFGDKLVAAMTLNPSDGNPVVFMERGNYRPSQNPTEAKLQTYLKNLRQSDSALKFGAYILPSSRGHEVQIYWEGKLVSYLYLNPKSFIPDTDETSKREISNSVLKVH